MKINYNREVASEDAPVRSNNSGLGINVAAKKVSVKEEIIANLTTINCFVKRKFDFKSL